MLKCKTCNFESDNGDSFCGNCGRMLTKDNENILISTLKSILLGVKNPSTFIRNSTNSTMEGLGIASGVIIAMLLVDAVILKLSLFGVFPTSMIFKLWLLFVVIRCLFIGVNVGVSYLFGNVFHKNIDVVKCLNVFVFSSAFLSVLFIIPSIVSFISTAVSILLFLMIACVNYLIIYKAFKDSFELEVKESIAIIITSYFVNVVIQSVLIKIIK